MPVHKLEARMMEAAWKGVEGHPLAPVPTVAASLAARAVLPSFILLAAVFLYWDAASVPIRLWDESRNVVNALEMRASGWSLVTTYGFKPDLWNTKPPLLIWLMNASLAVFGPEPWAFRLPTMVAALSVLLLTIHFARRYAGSLAVGIGAAAVLLLSPGFYGAHGARTADYDMLLTLFTTAYLVVLFPVISGRPTWGAAIGAGLLIAGSVLAKSSVGLLPGAGLLLYLLVTGRTGRMLRDRHSWLIAAVAIAAVMLFYLSREAAAPATFRRCSITRSPVPPGGV